jgi:hypothetical protein
VSEPDYEMMQLDAAKLGIEAEGFLASSLGRYLVERADLEIEKLTETLIWLSPSDITANTDVRTEIQVCIKFKQWLIEAINSGRVAARNIQESEAVDR